MGHSEEVSIIIFTMSERNDSNVVRTTNTAPTCDQFSHFYHFNSETSRSVAKEQTEPHDRQEELQQFTEDQTEKTKQKKQAGILTWLRKRVSLNSESEVTTWLTAPMGTAHNRTSKEVKDNVIITQVKRMPTYRCVSLPPGCIPTEVLLVAEGTSHVELDPRSESVSDSKSTRNRRGDVQQRAIVVSRAQRNEEFLPFEVLRNNWVSPN